MINVKPRDIVRSLGVDYYVDSNHVEERCLYCYTFDEDYDDTIYTVYYNDIEMLWRLSYSEEG